MSLDLFERECSRNRNADAYLLLGPSVHELRAFGEKAGEMLLASTHDFQQHPDAVTFDPDALGVSGLRVEHVAARKEGVSSVESEMRYRPSEGARRVFLLLRVDLMGPDAQTALLKTAEEPPAGTVLFMTARSTQNILPALLSRCRRYFVPGLSPEELDRRAAAAGLSDVDWGLLRAGYSSPQDALDESPLDRQAMLALAQSFLAWLDAPEDQTSHVWAASPEGGSIAEQREVGIRNLSACLGWISRAYPSWASSQQDRGDWICGELYTAVLQLRQQVSPGPVFEGLRASLRHFK